MALINEAQVIDGQVVGKTGTRAAGLQIEVVSISGVKVAAIFHGRKVAACRTLKVYELETKQFVVFFHFPSLLIRAHEERLLLVDEE